MIRNYTKSLNDDIESDFRGAGIPYQLKFREEYDTYTKILRNKYEFYESADLELYANSCESFHYLHLERPNWSGHVVLSRVFAGVKVCVRCRDMDSDRLFVIDGKFAGTVIDFFPHGQFVMFLQDFSFILVDNSSSIIAYDGERNEFYERANRLLRDFYKK